MQYKILWINTCNVNVNVGVLFYQGDVSAVKSWRWNVRCEENRIQNFCVSFPVILQKVVQKRMQNVWKCIYRTQNSYRRGNICLNYWECAKHKSIQIKLETHEIKCKKTIFLALFAVRWLQIWVFLWVWPPQAFYFINLSNIISTTECCQKQFMIHDATFRKMNK